MRCITFNLVIKNSLLVVVKYTPSWICRFFLSYFIQHKMCYFSIYANINVDVYFTYLDFHMLMLEYGFDAKKAKIGCSGVCCLYHLKFLQICMKATSAKSTQATSKFKKYSKAFSVRWMAYVIMNGIILNHFGYRNLIVILSYGKSKINYFYVAESFSIIWLYVISTKTLDWIICWYFFCF